MHEISTYMSPTDVLNNVHYIKKMTLLETFFTSNNFMVYVMGMAKFFGFIPKMIIGIKKLQMKKVINY